jgi:F-type H+-transporting ATPase subunit c
MAIEGAEIVKAAAFIGAGISMGLGAIGPGVGEGMVAAKACEAIGKNPKEAGLLNIFTGNRFTLIVCRLIFGK